MFKEPKGKPVQRTKEIEIIKRNKIEILKHYKSPRREKGN